MIEIGTTGCAGMITSLSYCYHRPPSPIAFNVMLLMRQLSTTTMCTKKPNDVNYKEVSTHYNDPCQPIPLKNNLMKLAYSVHKSGNELI